AKWNCSIVRISLLALTIMWATMPSQCSPQAKSTKKPADAVDYWVRKNYERALDLLLQDRCAAPALVDDQRSIHSRWIVCVRIVPAFDDEIEYLLSLEKHYDGGILAQIIQPKAHSIRAQLCQH